MSDGTSHQNSSPGDACRSVVLSCRMISQCLGGEGNWQFAGVSII